ncbi:glycosyltransferase [Denitrobaculum tricleocarpae]|uniref:Glycosyltransferase n=1 Tax=Denitrobaculum tricleocarpae TaxID=2591009 RepID=A0A545U2D3_9PROT|nr:glycosyltransferase [Denitrobaculum tricleocarpae]TQV83639.1 glycosyltransferase [Denitrobaculum tricleocarpae]
MIFLHRLARSGNEPFDASAPKTGGVSMISSGDRQPIPILFVLPNFRAGGAERVVLALLRLLDRSRFAPELVVFDGRGEFAELLPSDVVLHDIGVPRLRSAVWPLLRIIRKRRPAVVFSSHSYVSVLLLAVRAVFPAKTRIIVREPNTPSKSLPDMSYGKVLDLGYRALLGRADVVICLNSLAEKEMLSRYRVTASRLVRMANPVAVKSLRQAATEMIRVPGPGLRLVAAGRLSYSKGFDRLLEAMVRMPDESILTLYGAGPEEENLKALASRLSLGSKVRFAGFERQLAPVLAGADAVIVPSRFEGMPNIVLETLACGTSVVSTPEAGGVIDLVEVLTPDALALVSSQAELVEAMGGLKADTHASVRPSRLPRHFEEQHVVSHFEEIVLRALAGKEMPCP